MKPGKIRIVIETPNIVEISRAGLARLKASYSKSVFGRVKVKVSVVKAVAILILSAMDSSLLAQTNSAAPTFINGTMDIQFNTRTHTDGDGPAVGVSDKYTMNLNVCNSAEFRGTVTALPYIYGLVSPQIGSLGFNIDCLVVNPANPAQTRQLGKLVGSVAIDKNDVYHFSGGSVTMRIDNSPDRSFSGLAFGKPFKKTGFFSKVQQEMQSFQKQVGGKSMSLQVTNYDKMTFQNHVLAGGPVPIYSDAAVNGTMLYDYDRSSWYIQNIQVSYLANGNPSGDRLSGDIRWVPDANYDQTGIGHYEFDIRLNEPLGNESSVFAGAADESSFFQSDNNLQSLVGTMSYHDHNVGGKTLSSSIQIDLRGNKLSKQQVMYLCKLIMFSTIVPMNSD